MRYSWMLHPMKRIRYLCKRTTKDLFIFLFYKIVYNKV